MASAEVCHENEDIGDMSESCKWNMGYGRTVCHEEAIAASTAKDIAGWVAWSDHMMKVIRYPILQDLC